MLSRSGLRLRMAVSFVAVSAVAVVLVEGVVVVAVLLPRLYEARAVAERVERRPADGGVAGVQASAAGLAARVAAAMRDAAARATAAHPGQSAKDLLDAATQAGGLTTGDAASTVALATTGGDVVASRGTSPLPVDTRLPLAAIGTSARSGITVAGAGRAAWTTSPVTVDDGTGAGPHAIGLVYALAPLPDPLTPAEQSRTDPSPWRGLSAYVVPGLALLLALLPVGLLFGLLTTGSLVGRIRRLAERATATATAATGEPAGDAAAGGDEVTQLEQAFEAMAERIDASVASERAAAAAGGQQAERDRIARELHDSISQDLFSAGLMAGGLRKALPAESPLRGSAAAVEQTLQHTIGEMRGLLLQLRPVALDDEGLAATLQRLCRAYESRVGVAVTTVIDPLSLPPAVEHAVLRVAQEALGNAVRHGRPEHIELRLEQRDGRVELVLRDDGAGFDPAAAGEQHGLGLQLMRERVADLGGTAEIDSTPGGGTTVRVSIPEGRS